MSGDPAQLVRINSENFKWLSSTSKNGSWRASPGEVGDGWPPHLGSFVYKKEHHGATVCLIVAHLKGHDVTHAVPCGLTPEMKTLLMVKMLPCAEAEYNVDHGRFIKVICMGGALFGERDQYGDQKYAGVTRERGGTYIAKYESKDKSKTKKERMLRQTGLPSADEAARVANAWMHADRQFTKKPRPHLILADLSGGLRTLLQHADTFAKLWQLRQRRTPLPWLPGSSSSSKQPPTAPASLAPGGLAESLGMAAQPPQVPTGSSGGGQVHHAAASVLPVTPHALPAQTAAGNRMAAAAAAAAAAATADSLLPGGFWSGKWSLEDMRRAKAAISSAGLADPAAGTQGRWSLAGAAAPNPCDLTLPSNLQFGANVEPPAKRDAGDCEHGVPPKRQRVAAAAGATAAQPPAAGPVSMQRLAPTSCAQMQTAAELEPEELLSDQDWDPNDTQIEARKRRLRQHCSTGDVPGLHLMPAPKVLPATGAAVAPCVIQPSHSQQAGPRRSPFTPVSPNARQGTRSSGSGASARRNTPTASGAPKSAEGSRLLRLASAEAPVTQQKGRATVPQLGDGKPRIPPSTPAGRLGSLHKVGGPGKAGASKVQLGTLAMADFETLPTARRAASRSKGAADDSALQRSTQQLGTQAASARSVAQPKASMPPCVAAGAAKAAVLPEVASGGPAGPSGGLAPPRFGGMPGTVHRDRVKATNLAATNRYTGKSRKVAPFLSHENERVPSITTGIAGLLADYQEGWQRAYPGRDPREMRPLVLPTFVSNPYEGTQDDAVHGFTGCSAARMRSGAALAANAGPFLLMEDLADVPADLPDVSLPPGEDLEWQPPDPDAEIAFAQSKAFQQNRAQRRRQGEVEYTDSETETE